MISGAGQLDIDQLKLLKRSLTGTTFRFVIISQNHKKISQLVQNWIESELPNKKIKTIEFAGRDYHSFTHELIKAKDSIILIPDFDALFETKHGAVCTAFNQRRDFFAKNRMVLLCL